MVGLLLVSGFVVMSVSLLYMHTRQNRLQTIAEETETSDAEQNYIVFDDADLPEWENDTWLDEDSEQARHEMIMSFTRIHGKSEKQLPIIGLPDKALYNIH